MAQFVFGIGSGIRQALSPNILVPGIGVQLIKTVAFREAQGIPEGAEKDFEVLDPQQEEADAISYLGTPILDPFTFNGSNFFELDDIKGQNPIPFPDEKGADGLGLTIPNVIIEVNQSKNIITTPIQGRDGTVKEFISRGDYVITLSGIINGKMDEETGEVRDIGNVYPEDDVNKLITICEVPDSLDVTSTFLGMFLKEDSRVVITDYNIPQQVGVRNFQTFQINMLSDTPINLNELIPTTIINIQTRVPAEDIVIIEEPPIISDTS